jgi:hypothetical protein
MVIGKPSTIEKPTDNDEAKTMIINDISCVCEALCELIHIADQNGYASKDNLIETSIKLLNDMKSNNESPSDSQK